MRPNLETRPRLFPRVLLGFAGALAPLLVLGGFSTTTFSAMDAANKQARQAFLIRERLEVALSMLKDMENGAAEYALTGSPETLRRFKDAREAFDGAFESMRPLLIGDRVQTERLRDIQLGARLCAELTRRVVQLTAGGRRPDAGLLAAVQNAMDETRTAAAQMARAETSLMTERERQAARLARRGHAAVAGTELLAVLLIAYAAWAIAQGLRSREELAERVLASQERLAAILDNTPAVVFVKDAGGRYLFTNRRFEQLIGRSNAELRGMTDRELFPEETVAALRANDAAVLRTGALREAEEVIPLEGGARTYLSLKFPLPRRGPGPGLVCGIATDITERKHVERLKNEVLALATHELRSPLTVILGCLRLALDDAGAPLDAGTKELLEMSLRNSRHMLTLINTYLDLAALESGEERLVPADTDLGGMLADALKDVSAAAPELTLRLIERRAVAVVRADPERLREVLDNLLSNAVKFSPPGGTVTVRLHRRRAAWRVSVRDQGPGIRADFQARVFGKFSRDKAAQGRRHGSGLGLAIAKALVERMGGRIGFLTKEGAGTAFFFELPA